MTAEAELIGREAPLATIVAALGRMSAGDGGLILIRGEAGIGKSALAACAARAATAAGARVISGRAWELAEAPPYFPLWAALRDLGIPPPTRDATDAFQLWEQVLAELAQASQRTPRVWVLEDLHAADLLSLDLLTFLAGPLRALRVLVLVTARALDPRLTERAQQRFTRLLREGQDVQLEPLSAEQLARLGSRIAERRLPAAAVERLRELTGGNPLFVVECARSLRDERNSNGAVLPPTVRQVILERVALLPEATRRALSAGAVLGREFTAATVSRLLDALPARVIDDLAPALQAGTLLEARPAQFSFSHILVRDAIEAALSSSERSALHARAEQALSTLGESPEILVERARHALGALGPDGAGLQLARRAALLLAELGAFDRAYAMQRRIHDARAHVLGQPAGPTEQLELARLAQAAGRYQEARALCNEVLLQARAQHDAQLLAQAALVLGAELRPGTIDRELQAALERAHAELSPAPVSPGHAALACRVLARLAAVLQPAPDPAVPIALALDAIARARALGDEALLVEVLHVAGSALVDFAPIALRRATNEELRERAQRSADPRRELSALARLAMDYAEHGDFAAWHEATERGLELARAAGHPRLRARALLFASMRAVARGEVAESERLLTEVRELAALTDDPALSLSLFAHDGQRTLLLHLAAPEERLAHLETMPDVPHAPTVRVMLGAYAHARNEDVARTRALLAQLPPPPSVGLPTTWLAWLVEPCVLVQDLDKCRFLRDRLLAFPSPHLVSGHVPITYDGPVCRLLGLLDSALGDPVAAERQLRAALAEMERQGLQAWVAQLRYDLAQALTRAGGTAAAREQYARSAELAEQLGMVLLAQRARAQSAAQVSSAVPSTAGVPSTAPATPLAPISHRLLLTREGDVWRVEHGARLVRLKHSRGMLLLARLVEHPGQDVHVLALASDEPGSSLQDAGAAGIGGPDARARRDYKQRLDDLEQEIDEAEQAGDLGRVARSRAERERLTVELARAFGLGGTARPTGSATERARVNVQRRLKDVIARVGELDAELGRYLEKAVVTGTYCRFLA